MPMPDTDNNNISETPVKLRFGLLCNGYRFKKWQIKTIESLIESGIAELCLLIINDTVPVKQNFVKKLYSLTSRDFLYRIYTRFFLKPDSVKEVDLTDKFTDIASMRCRIIKKGKHSEIFSDADVAYIKEQKTDYILRFGFNIIRGEILKSARYGVWSYHHDDEKKYRGGPPGFREIFYKDKVNGIILQQLSEKLDSGIVLKKYFLKTVEHSYSGNVDNIFYGASSMPLQVCKDIINKKADYFYNLPSSSNARIYRVPSNLNMLKFLSVLIGNKIKFHCRELFCSEQWNVGIIRKPLAKLITEGISDKDVVWMPAQNPVKFRADSFAFADSKGFHVFFEDYDYRKRKGKISKVTYNEDTGFSEPSTVLEKDYHLAYPYIFEEDNNVYLIPETFENNQIDMYKIDKNTGGLQFHKTILPDIDAVDSTVFFYNGKWWLFCTKQSDNPNAKLFLFCSDKIDGSYTGHPANPVKTDIRSSRPAGKPFLINNALYRPAQDSSVTYGGRIALNKIVKLTAAEFEEETVGFTAPVMGSLYNKGIHTICEAGDYTVIDAKRFNFVGSAFRYHLMRKFKKVFKKNRNDK